MVQYIRFYYNYVCIIKILNFHTRVKQSIYNLKTGSQNINSKRTFLRNSYTCLSLVHGYCSRINHTYYKVPDSVRLHTWLRTYTYNCRMSISSRRGHSRMSISSRRGHSRMSISSRRGHTGITLSDPCIIQFSFNTCRNLPQSINVRYITDLQFDSKCNITFHNTL